MDARYEEKTYEGYFNNELDQKTSIYFPLGQVQEGTVGLDSAAHSQNQRLWKTVGYPFGGSPNFLGVDLRKIADEMEAYLDKEVKNIPSMKVNLLFQYKRPAFITRSSGKEWDLWNCKYFRYDLYAEQHDLLAHIEATFGNDAIVLYAAPAVEDVNELVKLKKKGAILSNSNFRRASELNGHHRNTYIAAGTYSQACSDPERLPNFNLLDLIEEAEPLQGRESRQVLVDFAKGVRASMEKSTYLRGAFEGRLSEFQDLTRYQLLYAVLSMSIFREITGTQWLVALNSTANKGNFMTQNETTAVDVNQLLLYAAAAGDLDLALATIEQGANPDCRDPRGLTPLMRAATYGDTKMLQLLIDAGATLDAVTEHGITALMKAAIHDRVDAARELLRCGANAGLRDIDGFTAEVIAVRLGNKAVAAVF